MGAAIDVPLNSAAAAAPELPAFPLAELDGGVEATTSKMLQRSVMPQLKSLMPCWSELAGVGSRCCMLNRIASTKMQAHWQ
jgi:hypothetical protein